MEIIVEAISMDERIEGCPNKYCPTYNVACQTNSDD